MTLETFIERYAELENRVRELVEEKCRPLCLTCTCFCCDAIICSEAVESPFLKRVHQQSDRYSEKNGFTSKTGCTLHQGRPPVCYEYFCDNHFYYQPDEQHEKVLKILGALPTHALRNADGDVPLTEIMDEQQLDQVDFAKLGMHLAESFRALEIVRAFYRDGTLSDEAARELGRIQLCTEWGDSTVGGS